MKSILGASVSRERLWEFSFLLLGFYLLTFPAWTYPQSTAVALGGGLLLLLLRDIPGGSLSLLGGAWWSLLFLLPLGFFWSLSPGLTLQSSGFLFLASILYLMGRSRDEHGMRRMEILGLLFATWVAWVALEQYASGFEKMALLLPSLPAGENVKVLTATAHNQRAFGTLATPGSLGALLILFIPRGFIFTFTKSGLKRIFFGGITLLMGAGLLATQSVGPWVCLTLAVVLLMAWRKSVKGVLILSAFGALGVGFVLFRRGLQSWHLASYSMRLELWKSAWALFLRHPWLGTGLGTFDVAYRQSGFDLRTGARFAHNLPLQFLVETGVIGTLVLITALTGFVTRLKMPSRWEGWGALAGVLAFFLFSFLDLPFQMPELVWFFAMAASRVELKPEKSWGLPKFSASWLARGLLAIFFITGFWPPFRPWNLALLAVSLWTVFGAFRKKWKSMPLWMAGGFFYLGARAFFSPSALGAVWFLEILGFLLAFYLTLPLLGNPRTFMGVFFALGLGWALKIWWFSIRYSDMKYWTIFPNPKQIGIVLAVLTLFLWAKPWSRWKTAVILMAALTMARLRAFAGFFGLLLGLASKAGFRRLWVFGGAIALVGGVMYWRSMDLSSTRNDRIGIWESAAQVWTRRPLVGVGPGAFAGLYDQVKIPREQGASRYLMDARYAHNEFLDFLAAFGILGFSFAVLLFWDLKSRLRANGTSPAWLGLAAASGVDFCLHTPLIALQGAGLFFGRRVSNEKPSWEGAFLALGLSLGLFGSAAFTPAVLQQAAQQEAAGQYPQSLESLEAAGRLNAWDARIQDAQAIFLEKLFLATKDPVWRLRSDEVFQKALDLEKTDGLRYLRRADRWTARLKVDPSPESIKKAEDGWKKTREVLPFNAFARYGEGLFFLEKAGILGKGSKAFSGDDEKALADFRESFGLEPNFSSAWAYAGICLRKKFGTSRDFRDEKEAQADFKTALGIYDRWKDAQRIDPLEVRLVGLDPEMAAFLEKEIKYGK